MQARVIIVAVLLAGGACGGRQPAGAGQPDPQPPPADTASATPTPTVTPPPPLREADCAALFAHIVDVGLAEQRATLPPDQVPSRAQRDEIVRDLTAAGTPECLRMDRASHACAMAAGDGASLTRCLNVDAATAAP